MFSYLSMDFLFAGEPEDRVLSYSEKYQIVPAFHRDIVARDYCSKWDNGKFTMLFFYSVRTPLIIWNVEAVATPISFDYKSITPITHLFLF